MSEKRTSDDNMYGFLSLNFPEECQAPLDYLESEKSYYDLLKKRFEIYEKWLVEGKKGYIPLDNFSPIWNSIGVKKENVLSFVQALSNMLLEVLEYVGNGKRTKASNHFEEFITQNTTLFLEEERGFFAYNSLKLTESENDFYRIRVKEDWDVIERRKDLFHPPYSLSKVVKTFRFSNEGVPYLYLGKSLFASWKELGEPDLGKCMVSRFRMKAPTQSNDKKLDNYLINLAFDFRLIFPFTIQKKNDGKMRPYSDDRCIAYQLLMLPLVLACSVKRKHLDVKYNEEYVIPNIFLEYLHSRDLTNGVKQGCVGIRFYSTHKYYVKNLFNSDRTLEEFQRYEDAFVNYVFVGNREPYSFDDSEINTDFSPILQKSFKLTNPISWNQFRQQSGTKNLIVHEQRAEEGDYVNYDNFLIANYKETEFFKFEIFLNQFECAPVEI